MPDFIAGYDLVGEEGNLQWMPLFSDRIVVSVNNLALNPHNMTDPGHPLLYFLDDFLALQQGPGDANKLPFFFHAGETDRSTTAMY